ncbi:MAG: trimethylamine methyltransferase family protein, partial [Actinobacteria bacterium]|nr:trimethylamine methyltransferase family protein [Actinomycetota bacterium]
MTPEPIRDRPKPTRPSRQYRCEKPLEVLSAAELEQVHQATLQVLWETGVVFQDEGALDLLAEGGCSVDHRSSVARIPSDVVEAAVRRCPAAVQLRSRDGRSDVLFDGVTVQFAAGSGMRRIDPVTGDVRPGTVADGVRTARLTDALEVLSGVNTGLGFIADRPTEINLVWNYAICCRNSGKILSLAAMEDSLPWGVRMAEVAGQDVIFPLSSTSPLAWDREQIEGLKVGAAAGRPVVLLSMASPGISGPVTLSGAAVVMNAEILAGLVLAQLLRPGLGVIYSCLTMPIDMRLGTVAAGSMELALLDAVAAQLARRYRLGTLIYGPNTDAKVSDEQAGYERMNQYLLAAMAGTSLIWGAGMTENHSLFSDAQVIVDAEMAGMVGRYLEGVSLDHLQTDVALIGEVGHFPHNYLRQRATRRLYRAEH